MHQPDAAHARPVFLVPFTLSLGLLLAACNGGGGATPTTAATTPSASASASASASESAPASGAMNVSLENFAFSPTTLTVPVGSTVTFTNNDITKHTATQGKDGRKADNALFDLQLEQGASDTFTFDTAGTYEVTCTIHAQMNMTITVE